MTLIFGALFLVLDIGWMLIPLLFAGILPMARGAGRYLEERSEKKRLEERRRPKTLSSDDRERIVLKSAQRHAGVVTPTILAVETDLTIAQAEETLEDLVRRGYASLEVRENGGLEYHFPDLADSP